MDRQRVLFICIHNSARSQMAEAMLRAFAGDRFEVFSAGIEASTVRPEAIAVMDEIGLDIRQQESKTLERYLGQPFAWLITVCDTARQQCPVFPGVEQTAHWGIDDPADVSGTEEERLLAFRMARDELRNRIRLFVATASRPEMAPVEAHLTDR
jgi:arsenate reductase (thioredoxin)